MSFETSRALLTDPVRQLALTAIIFAVLYMISLYGGRQSALPRIAVCATAISLVIALLSLAIAVVANGKGSLLAGLFAAVFFNPSAAGALICLGIWMLCERAGVPYIGPLVAIPLSIAAIDMLIRASGYVPDIR